MKATIISDRVRRNWIEFNLKEADVNQDKKHTELCLNEANEHMQILGKLQNKAFNRLKEERYLKGIY